MSAEVRAIACNYADGTKIARPGARAYLLWRTGGENRRCKILVKSRGGRWVVKWEAIWRLDKFRVVRVPPVAPEYDRLLDWTNEDPAAISYSLDDIVGCQLGALADRAQVEKRARAGRR